MRCFFVHSPMQKNMLLRRCMGRAASREDESSLLDYDRRALAKVSGDSDIKKNK